MATLGALVVCLLGVLASVRSEVINVHIVPHTHDDVGWLKTVDEYYSGTSNNYANVAVKNIITSVVEELQKDPKRTFIYVEIAFFIRWWRTQSADTQDIVKTLVKNKQLEFVNAGWCMNDEAGTDYNAIIDQVQLVTACSASRVAAVITTCLEQLTCEWNVQYSLVPLFPLSTDDRRIEVC